MKVGTICKLKVDCLGNKAGTLGVVFYDYGSGFQVIFENGNYDGFSTDEELLGPGLRIEADYFLEEIGFEGSLAGYKFKNVGQVSADYARDVFDIAWSKGWKKFAEGRASVAEPAAGQTCRICGCTDSKACEGGCFWAWPGICSKCVTREVPLCIDLLIETIVVSHPDDKEETCSTCNLIKAARKIAAALRQ